MQPNSPFSLSSSYLYSCWRTVYQSRPLNKVPIPDMKKSITILSALAVIKLTLQLLGNRNYGFHRDELLHLSVSEHLDWGYMEFPPMIAWVGRLSYWLFDYSLMGTRLFPTLAGVLLLILCGLMARAFSKQPYAVLLAGFCVLAFVPFYRNHTLFQPVAFDQLFWTLGFYLMVLFFNSPWQIRRQFCR